MQPAARSGRGWRQVTGVAAGVAITGAEGAPGWYEGGHAKASVSHQPKTRDSWS